MTASVCKPEGKSLSLTGYFVTHQHIIERRDLRKLNALLFAVAFFASVFTSAHAQDEKAPVPPELRQLGGMGAALSGGGTAHVYDLSTLDLNPAGIAQKKDVYIGGEFFWRERNVRATEVGVLDSTMSQIAAGLKMRQTNKITGVKDRRFSLALGGQLPDYPLLVGVAGDYSQIEKVDLLADAQGNKKKTPDDNLNLRFGGLLSLSPSVQVGVRSQGYLDKEKEFEHAAGVTIAVAGYYFLNGDLIFDKEGPRRGLGGVTVEAKDYLDLLLSYGYELRNPMHLGAAGIALKSEKFRLLYTVSKPNLREALLLHSLGARLTFAY